MTTFTIMRVEAEAVVDLRERVMWPGRRDMCVLAEDAAGVHLGAVDRRGATSDQQPPLIGVISLFMDEGGVARFRKLCTHPERRCEGIGSALVIRSIVEAEEAGAVALECDSRQSASKFYSRLGFQQVGAPFTKYAGAPPYVRMRRDLNGR